MPYIDIDKSKIKVLESKRYPDRPTIVFLHHSLGCIDTWKQFPIKLSEATRCNFLIYDRLGHGKSDPLVYPRGFNYLEIEADILDRLLDELKLVDVILFGHSDGGTIGLIEASNHRERTLGVITVAAHVFVESITINGIQRTIEKYSKQDLKEKLTKYHGVKTETLFSSWTDIWLNDEFYSWNIIPMLGGIQCPCLVIQGDNDEFGSIDQVKAIVGKTTGTATSLLLSNIGHSPHIEAPEVTIKRSVDFIERILIENNID